MAEYENKIALMSQEIERLNDSLRKKVDEIGTLNKQLQALRGENDELSRGNNESGMKIAQITQSYSVQISSYETKINQCNIQIEELTSRIRELTNANQRLNEYEINLRKLTQENDGLSSQLRQKVE